MDQVEEELASNGGDEEDEDLWQDFLTRFKSAYLSTTQKEDAYVRMQKLQMNRVGKVRFRTMVRTRTWPNRTVVRSKVRGLGRTGPSVRFSVRRGREFCEPVLNGFGPNRTRTSACQLQPKNFQLR